MLSPKNLPSASAPEGAPERVGSGKLCMPRSWVRLFGGISLWGHSPVCCLQAVLCQSQVHDGTLDGFRV